jgi:aromatic ring-opening dioxygenase catalytic subunit (LigB family)
LRYDAPGDPDLAKRAAGLLLDAGLASGVDYERGWDHGVFVPLKVAFPDADIPVVEMSLDRSLDPALHAAAGRALAPLRDEGVLIVGSGMSFHNMRAYGDPRALPYSQAFDQWLTAAAVAEPAERAKLFAGWSDAPAGRVSHPREEHLIPLMVAAGASAAPGQHDFSGAVMGTQISGYRFG